MSKYLTVIIPCYNEEENLKRGVLSEVFNYLKGKDFDWEVIISDDGSTDKSREIVKTEIKKFKNFKLLENPHGGKPSALYYGIKKAEGNWVLFTDMDQSTPIGELDKLLPYADKDYSAIIGSRGLSRKDFPVYRKLGAMVFATIRRFLILPEITDTQCGFKMFKNKVLKENFSKLEFFRTKEKVSGWSVTSWDVEFLHILKSRSYTIKEVVVDWKDRDVSKGKDLGLKKYVKESKEMFAQILRVKINDIRGMYK